MDVVGLALAQKGRAIGVPVKNNVPSLSLADQPIDILIRKHIPTLREAMENIKKRQKELDEFSKRLAEFKKQFRDDNKKYWMGFRLDWLKE